MNTNHPLVEIPGLTYAKLTGEPIAPLDLTDFQIVGKLCRCQDQTMWATLDYLFAYGKPAARLGLYLDRVTAENKSTHGRQLQVLVNSAAPNDPESILGYVAWITFGNGQTATFNLVTLPDSFAYSVFQNVMGLVNRVKEEWGELKKK